MKDTVTALVSVLSTRHRKAVKEDMKKRMSKYEQYGDGCVSVLYTIKGDMPEQKEKPLAISMSRCPVPVHFRKGDKLQIKGIVEPLTKKQDIFYVLDICVPTEIGERAVAKKMGKSAQGAREELIQEGKGFMLIDAPSAVPEISRQDIAALHNFLYYHGYGFDLEMAYYIDAFFKRRVRHRTQGERVADVVMKNPLMLCELGFCDAGFSPANVMRAFHIEPTPKMRLYAKIASFLQLAASKGDTFIPMSTLYGVVAKDLEGMPKNFLGDVLLHDSRDDGFVGSLAKLSFCVGKNQFEGMAGDALAYFKATLDKERPSEEEKNARTARALFFAPVFYLRKNFFCERHGAEDFAARLLPERDVSFTIEANRNFTYEQRNAVSNAFLYRTSVIVGCAGSGKTAVVSDIVRIAKKNGKSVVVLAPSAKAALRAADEIKKQTGENSDNYTIHRFAKILPEDADAGEDGDYLPCNQETVPNFVIVDEMSMCELYVFSRLLRILKNFPKTHLVLVGDSMQLPAIGPQFFHQLADGFVGSALPVTRLTKNFRAKNDALAALGENIRKGIFQLPDSKSVHFSESTIDAFMEEHQDLVRDENVMFLSSRKADIEIMNKVIRKLRHPDAKQIGTTPFYIGDRVVTVQNDYAESSSKAGRHPERVDDVYNGTEGVIEEVKDDTVYIRMWSPEFGKEGKRIPYLQKELSVFVIPAFAETVHKALGSQYDRVVFFLPSTHRVSRNLIYTAVTRAMSELYLVGKADIYDEGVKKFGHTGNSFFALRVAKALEKVEDDDSAMEDALII